MTQPLKKDYGSTHPLDIRTYIQERFRTRLDSWFEWVFDRLELPTTSRVLELGSGTGLFWLANASRLPDGWQVILSDITTAMFEISRQVLHPIRNQFSFILSDASVPPIRSQAVDAVLALGLLDYLEDVSTALENIRLVMRPDARLYASTGAQDHLDELCDLVNPYVPGARLGTAGDQFTLENGKGVLMEHFREVQAWEYTDRLQFPDVGSVIAYIRSESAVNAALNAQDLADLKVRIEAQFRLDNKLIVKTHKALFEARV